MKRYSLLACLGLVAFAAAFAATRFVNRPDDPPPGMVWVAGGEFTTGAGGGVGRPEERPAHRVRVNGFWMDETVVTNAQFCATPTRRSDLRPFADGTVC